MNLLTPRNITLGFYAAAVTNIAGMWLFSQFYTNSLMSALYPGVFSTFGIVCIQLWGLAYWAVAKSYAQVPWLVTVFALEKLAYVVSWVLWMSQHGAQLPQLIAESPFTAQFYAVYGFVDFTFGVFFAAVALKGRHA